MPRRMRRVGTMSLTDDHAKKSVLFRVLNVFTRVSFVSSFFIFCFCRCCPVFPPFMTLILLIGSSPFLSFLFFSFLSSVLSSFLGEEEGGVILSSLCEPTDRDSNAKVECDGSILSLCENSFLEPES